MSEESAKLQLPSGTTIDLPVYKPSEGFDVIDIRALGKTGYFTYDPGFMATASCESKITYIDGGKGILLYRGYSIDELADDSDFTEVCYLLLNGELPNAEEKQAFTDKINNHTMVHEQIHTFFNGFRRDAHPMAIMVAVVGAMSAFIMILSISTTLNIVQPVALDSLLKYLPLQQCVTAIIVVILLFILEMT